MSSTAPTTAAPTPAAPTPTSTPEPAPAVLTRLVISLDDVSAEYTDHVDSIDYGNAAGAIALIESIAGAPVVTEVPQKAFTRYEWDGVQMVTSEAGQFIITIATSSVGAVPVQTAEGVAVGSSRADSVAAGATDGYDGNGDGVADSLHLGTREVPGTESLALPDAVGVEYVELRMDGDAVTHLVSPADDFHDL